MKLVDILARELKEWPANSVSCVQDKDLEIRFHSDTTHGDFFASVLADKDDEVYLSDGIPYAGKVTRAQWKAAVDALKAESSSKCWLGIGLPPIGTVCEYLEDGNGDWEEVTIIAIDHRLDYKFAVFHGDKGYSGDRRTELFRPIRTPEQIAAEERKNQIEIMSDLVGDIDEIPSWDDALAKLYDAGYRKFEIVDGEQ